MGRDVSKFLAAEHALWSKHGITPTDRRVKLRGGNEVRIQQVGDGPPVVFIHGVSVAGSSWVLLADELKDDFTCLLMFKQVGMERAIETGTFDDDMVAWSIAVMKHTETLRNEMRNNPFITLRGLNPDVLLTDEELAKLQSPVLLLWGEEDTNAGEPEARAFAARLPNAMLEIVREAGHTPWIDEIEFCAEKTRAFLSS